MKALKKIMRLIICGCKKRYMEYFLSALGLLAKRDRKHLTVTAPDECERNDDMCRYITMGEDIHTDIGKGMADALVVYRYAAGIRRIENLKNSGKLLIVRETFHPAGSAFDETADFGMDDILYASSPSARRAEAYLKELLYLKSDAVIIEKRKAAYELFEFYTEEEILKLLGFR